MRPAMNQGLGADEEEIRQDQFVPRKQSCPAKQVVQEECVSAVQSEG